MIDIDTDRDAGRYIVDRDIGRNRCTCIDICTGKLAWPEFRAGLPGSLLLAL